MLQIADASGHIQIAAVDAGGMVGAGAGDGLHLHPPVLDGVVLFTAVRHLPAVDLPSWNKSSKWFSLNIFFFFLDNSIKTILLIQQSWRGVPFEHLFGGEIYFSRVKILCAEWKLSALKFMMRIWFDKHKIEIFPQNFTFLCTCLFYRVNNAIFTDKNHVCEWKVA